ncbi:MAG TPA: DinB family protein [Gemmatimonadales bacterium]|nr:DinB family protein [Gemmatimonadales bacterium]
MKRLATAAGSLGLSVLLAGSAGAQAAPAGLRADLLAQLDDAATKLVRLAEAIPAEKYTWRPAEGVRSVSQVLVHVAGGNFLFPTMVGVEPGARPPRDAEQTVTDKAQVVDWLKRSFEHARSAIRGVSDAALDQSVDMFGRQTSGRNVLLTMVSHAHEHLGQLIAYARTTGVTPPWSVAGN